MAVVYAIIVAFSVVAPFTVPAIFREYSWRGWILVFVIVVVHVLVWQFFSHEKAMVLFLSYEIFVMPFAPIVIDELTSNERS